jgi:hypothetical protein
LAAVAGLLACADLDGADFGVCGNNVVELDDGEDCDTIADPSLGEDIQCAPPGGAQECRYVCDGAECPRGWACGDDGICRAPSGEFEVDDTPVSFLRADQLLLADVADDEIAEVVVRLGGEVYVFATGDDGFTQQIELSLPNARGDLFAYDLDEDEYADLLMPAASRFADPGAIPWVHVLHGQGERLVSSVVPQTAIDALPGGDPSWTRTLGVVAVAAEAMGAGQVALQVVARDGDARLSAVVASPDCRTGSSSGAVAIEGTSASSVLLPMSAARLADGQLTHAALAFAGQTRVALVTVARRCEASACDPVSPAYPPCVTDVALAAELEFPAPIDPAGCSFFDGDGDGDVDLVCHLQGGQMAIATNTGGVVDPPVTTAAFATLAQAQPGQSRTCDASHRILAAGDLDGDGDDDVVTPHGIFVREALEFRRVYARLSGDAWGEAVLGDFDRDGMPEIVVADRRADSDCDGAQLSRLAPTGESYNALAIRNVSLPSRLRSGDFDGDGAGDVAMVERASGDEVLVSVLYGDTKEPLEDKASVGAFGSIAALTALRDREGTEVNEELIGDLAIVSDGGEAWTLVRGRPGRSLVSPLHLDVADGPAWGEGVTTVLAGPLVDRPSAGADGDEIEPGPPDVLVLGGPHRWLLRDDDVHHGDDVVHWRDEAATSPLSRFRVSCARWAVLAERPALIVGVDGAGAVDAGLPEACDTEDPAPQLLLMRLGSRDDPSAIVASTTAVTGPHRRPVAVQLLDFDGSGAPDVLMHFSGGGAAARGSLVLALDPSAESGAAFVELAADLDVVAMTVLNVDRDDAPEIAAMTQDGLWILDHRAGEDEPAWSAVAAFEAPVPWVPGQSTRMVAGELDGDGIEDLALLWGESLFLIPAVPVQ